MTDPTTASPGEALDVLARVSVMRDQHGQFVVELVDSRSRDVMSVTASRLSGALSDLAFMYEDHGYLERPDAE